MLGPRDITNPTFWETAWASQRRVRIFLGTMAALNVGFALVNIYFWSFVAAVLIDPISWATWSSVGSVGSRPDLWDYPFVLLWGLPLAGSAIATLNNMMGFRKVAKVAAIFPLSLYVLTLGWYVIFKDTIQ